MKENEKIGILTFQNTVNYGAQLQNYALQTYLEENNQNVEVINYINSAILDIEKPKPFFAQKGLKNKIKYFRCHKYHQKKWFVFEEFRRKYIKMSKEYNVKNISEVSNYYSQIIVGSDQVWNIDITKNDYTYFLNMISDSNKKLSYAASFGFSKFPHDEKAIINYLNEFKYLNLREKSALSLVQSIENKNKNVVVDPTFLLSKEDWIKKFNLINKEKSDYIFVYMIDETKKNLEELKKISERENLKIIHIRDGFRNLKGIVSKRDSSPIEFLDLLYNAKYVVTGSFHGLCLSIIFEKQFYYFLNNKYNRNTRLIDMLNMLGLEDRKKFNNLNEIDYTKVNKNLRKKIEKSKRIIDEMLRRNK